MEKNAEKKNPVSEKEFKEMMATKGETRGVTFKNYEGFILQEKGKEGVKKMEEALAQLGYPMKFGELHGWEFYPLGLEAVILVLMKRLFDFGDDKIEESGFFASRVGFIIKIFLSHFVSMKKFVEQAPVIWRKFYSEGVLDLKELNEEKRYAIATVRDFPLHPLHCIQLIGYLRGVVEMITGGKVTCEETKCFFKGDGYHEFIVRY